MSVFFDESSFSTAGWPTDFEELLKTDPYAHIPDIPLSGTSLRTSLRPSARHVPIVHEQYPFKSFFGTVRDNTHPAHVYGRLNGLPPQNGVPGFQRIVFIKYCPLANGFYDERSVWGYEGCVLPGGRIIVGRWFDATEFGANTTAYNRMTGPFIYWNVDESKVKSAIGPEEAVGFLQHLNEAHGIGNPSFL